MAHKRYTAPREGGGPGPMHSAGLGAAMAEGRGMVKRGKRKKRRGAKAVERYS